MAKRDPIPTTLVDVNGTPVTVNTPQPDGRIVLNPNGFSYFADGFGTIHNADFTKEPAFVDAYAVAIGANVKLDVRWRAQTAIWAAVNATRLEGDFVECGVWHGTFSRAICQYLSFEKVPRKFYLLDTYEGVPEDLLTESEKPNAAEWKATYGDYYDTTAERFSAYPNVKLVKGRVPDTLTQVPSESIAYLSIDMNSVVPEIAAGEFFWPKLSPGAVILLDDYGWRKHGAQKAGWDAFAAARGLRVLALPTGQGIIVKAGH